MSINGKLCRDIAIIGLAYRLPHSRDSKDFWDMLIKGRDAVESIPEKRLNDIKTYSKYDKNIDIQRIEKGSYLEHIDYFDSAFFNISPSDALYMDPIQRILLETSWHALEDAGYTQEMVANTNTGVFIGSSSEGDYKKIIQNTGFSNNPLSILGNCIPVISGRISHCLNLKGPNMIVNTACSSSLVAVHLACKSLNEEECNMAIAGGIELRIIPYRYTKIGIEATSNKTKTFDNDSDGTGSGEGAAVIVLKRYHEAIKDGDHIYCIIKGSAVNHDGNALSISAPNPSSQEAVLCRAWENAGINPSDISYIEAHGTGTKLGDPIEVYAMNSAFQKYTSKSNFCAIGSVKSNLGHLDSAAGIAGLVKVILCIQNKILVPSVNFNYPNTKIDFISSALYVNDTVRQFGSDSIICGVSSFGLSGTNCHVILSTYPKEYEKENDNREYGVFTISAKTKEALITLMEEYIKWIETSKNISYLDLCYTTNKRRNHYEKRFACVIQSNDDLLKLLKINLEKKNDSEYVLCLKAGNEIPYRIACNYINKKVCDWSKLERKRNYKVISTVPYPFERNRFWICREENVVYDKSSDVRETKKNMKDLSKIHDTLVEIIMKTLGYHEIDTSLSFYSLGGNSIHTLAIANEIDKVFEVEVDINYILEAVSIDDFCNGIIEKIHDMVTNEEKIDLYQRNVSKVQERIYFGCRIKKDKFVSSHCLKMDRLMNIPKIQKVLQQLLNTHEIFRTSFELRNNSIMNIVHEECPLDFEELMIKDNEQIELEKLMEQQMKRRFDVGKLPLIRFIWVSCETQSYFIVVSHHIICDGTSIYNFMEEFFQIYHDEKLPDNRLEYKKCIFRINKIAKEKVAKFSKTLPLNLQKPHFIKNDVERLFYRVPRLMYEQMISYINMNKVGLLSFLVLTFSEILYELTSERKYLFGIILSGRSNTSYSRVIGPFVNLMPLYLDIDTKKSFKDQLIQMDNHINLLRKYEAIQLEDIYEETGINYLEYMSCIFNLIYIDLKHREEYKLSPILYGRKTTDVGMNIDIYVHEHMMEIHFVYQKKLFSKLNKNMIEAKFSRILGGV